MQLKQGLFKQVIRVSKHFLKGTPLERIPLVSKLYRTVSILGFGAPKSPLKFRDFELHFDTVDESILPGLLNGTYEEFELDWMESVLKPGDCMIDVGANIGIYAVTAARAVGPGGKVLAVEPSPKAVSILRLNAKNYPQIEILPKALGITSQAAYLDEKPKALGSSQISFTNAGHAEVEMLSLDQAFKESRLDLVKIDVEGHERQVLLGAKEVLARFQPLVLMEWNPYLFNRDQKSSWAREIFELFQAVSYISNKGEILPLHRASELEPLGLVNLILESFRTPVPQHEPTSKKT